MSINQSVEFIWIIKKFTKFYSSDQGRRKQFDIDPANRYPSLPSPPSYPLPSPPSPSNRYLFLSLPHPLLLSLTSPLSLFLLLFRSRRQRKSNLVHFSLEIWHLMAPILLFFFRVNWPQCMHFSNCVCHCQIIGPAAAGSAGYVPTPVAIKFIPNQGGSIGI